jgi:hypothetical protein
MILFSHITEAASGEAIFSYEKQAQRQFPQEIL